MAGLAGCFLILRLLGALGAAAGLSAAAVREACSHTAEARDTLLLQTRSARSSLTPLTARVVQREACHTAVAGEPCYEAVAWAMHHGVHLYPQWYPGLTPESSFEDFQRLLHVGGHGPTVSGPPLFAQCREPCPVGAEWPPPLAAASWAEHPQTNCFPEHGAAAVGPDEPLIGVNSLEACKAACLLAVGCTGFVVPSWTSRSVPCYLRAGLCPAACVRTPIWVTYELDGSARQAGCEAPTTPAPTEEPSGGGSGDGGGDAPEGTTSTTSTGTTTTATTTTTTTEAAGDLAWRTSGRTVGDGQWCMVQEPAADWDLFTPCGGGFRLKVLAYNLFWWNLFGVRNGNGGSAGKMIAETGAEEPYDVMGFQECRNVWMVLDDAGLSQDYVGVQWNDGDIALGLAYRRDRFEVLEEGHEHVAEDRPEQYYGRRGGQWMRLQDRETERVVFVVNHHGPLPVDSGGLCGGEATAFHLLRLIGQRAKAGDSVVLLGDMNAGVGSVTQNALGSRLHRVNSNWVDSIFSSCGGEAVIDSAVLPNGGSDHPALFATLDF